MAQVRAPMPTSRRAKQFSMFDALKGFKEALAAKERQPEPRRELAQDAIEEINRTICELRTGELVTVVYYCRHQGEYCQLTGKFVKIDIHQKTIHIGVKIINSSDIFQIT